MAKILITSGPTRQYIDPVRYLSNASSGKMGSCLAQAALDLGHEVVVVSGPVVVEYPEHAEVIDVISTDDLLSACRNVFRSCDGVIAAAAPCDYQPINVADHKIRKTGETLTIELVETTDVMASLGVEKDPHQWSVGFALETDDARFRALSKLQRKCCDLVVLNGATAINSDSNSIEIINPKGEIVFAGEGPKPDIAASILATIQSQLITPDSNEPADESKK